MTKKDIAFLKRMIGKTDYTPITKIASCYIDINRDDIRFQDTQSFFSMDESEISQYCNFLKKGISGKLGTTAIDMKVNENLLEPIRDTSLADMDKIKTVAMTIRENYASEENYSIFFAYGTYDLPSSNGNDSEEVYEFVLVLLQPCGLSKPGIKYDSPKNEFSNRLTEPMLGAPVYAFLYPALDELHTDIDHAVFYSKNEKLAGKAGQIIPALFGTEIPLSPSSQKEGFHDLLQSAFEDNVPFEAVNDIYDHFQETLVDMQLSGEDVKISEKELVDAIIEYGNVTDEKQEELQKAAEEYHDCKFSVSNLVPEKVNIDTGDVVLKTELEKLSNIERRVIDGIDYYLVPANSSLLDGIQLANKR